jgi:hypothetical protein
MGIRSLRLGILVATATAVAVFGGVAVGASSRPASPPTEATNRAAAQEDASDLLGMLELPPGSTYSSVEPAGTNPGLYEFVPRTPPEPRTLVDRGGWWIVPGEPNAVLESIEAPPPSGSRLDLHGFRRANAKSPAEVRYAEFKWPPVPGVLGGRELFIVASKQADGTTVLRIDAIVAWIIPHPASEQIPPAAHALDVEVRRLGSVLKSVTVTNPRAVRKIASLINGLPVRQPDPVLCDFGSDGTRYILTFRASPTGPPLAEAAQALPVIRGCTFMRLSIGGHRQMPLERAGAVLRKLKSLQGKHIPQD